MGRRTLRTLRVDYGELPVVQRDHYAAPHLADEQAFEALRGALHLQECASRLDPQHAREHNTALRRRRVIRLAVLVFVLEIEAAVAVFGDALGWFPS